MLKLYVLPGSSHSQEAVRLLEALDLTFSQIELSRKSELAAASRDLGITALPTLSSDSSRYVGLDQIRGFVDELRRSRPAAP